MPEKKCYRYGNWTRNKRLRITDEPQPWFKPWQRTKTEVVMNDTWPYDMIQYVAGGGEQTIEYATDEEVARDRLRQRFAPEPQIPDWKLP